jgi:hypothetical protein
MDQHRTVLDEAVSLIERIARLSARIDRLEERIADALTTASTISKETTRV